MSQSTKGCFGRSNTPGLANLKWNKSKAMAINQLHPISISTTWISISIMINFNSKDFAPFYHSPCFPHLPSDSIARHSTHSWMSRLDSHRRLPRPHLPLQSAKMWMAMKPKSNSFTNLTPKLSGFSWFFLTRGSPLPNVPVSSSIDIMDMRHLNPCIWDSALPCVQDDLSMSRHKTCVAHPHTPTYTTE